MHRTIGQTDWGKGSDALLSVPLTQIFYATPAKDMKLIQPSY